MLIVLLVVVILVGGAVALVVIAAWAWRTLLRFDKGMARAYAEARWRSLFPARAVGWEVLERRILTKMRRCVTISVGGTCVVPSSFRVGLAPEDLGRLSGVRLFLEDELSRRLFAEARSHHWRCQAPPTLMFGVDPAVPRGFPLVEAAFGDDATRISEPAPGGLRRSRTVGVPQTRTTMDPARRNRTPVEKALRATPTEPWVVMDLRSTDDAHRDFELSDLTEDVTVGRSTASDMVLEVPTVSNNHAVLRRVDAGWEIEDLGSLNGTFRNGRLITAPVALAHGDHLSFSRAGPRFRFTCLEQGLPVRRVSRTSA